MKYRSNINQIKENKVKTRATPFDPEFEKIEGYIFSMAENVMKSSDLKEKKKNLSSLSDGHSGTKNKLASKSREDIAKWKRLLGLPTDLYRICIYPNSNINYYKWCNNNFFGSKNKKDSNNFF